MSKPSSPAPLATSAFRQRRLRSSASLTVNASAPLPLTISRTTVPTPPMAGSLSEIDTLPASANDDVAGDEVAAALLDADAAPVSREAVPGDHVSVAGSDDDAGAVPNTAVASHLVAVSLHEDSVDVAEERVPVDQVVVRIDDVDAELGVAPEGVVEDRVSWGRTAQPVPRRELGYCFPSCRGPGFGPTRPARSRRTRSLTRQCPRRGCDVPSRRTRRTRIRAPIRSSR